MQDVVFVVLVVSFLVRRRLPVRPGGGRGCPQNDVALASDEVSAVTFDNVVGLILAVALVAYLMYALVAPERL